MGKGISQQRIKLKLRETRTYRHPLNATTVPGTQRKLNDLIVLKVATCSAHLAMTCLLALMTLQVGTTRFEMFENVAALGVKGYYWCKY